MQDTELLFELGENISNTLLLGKIQVGTIIWHAPPPSNWRSPTWISPDSKKCVEKTEVKECTASIPLK